MCLEGREKGATVKYRTHPQMSKSLRRVLSKSILFICSENTFNDYLTSNNYLVISSNFLNFIMGVKICNKKRMDEICFLSRKKRTKLQSR